MNKLNETLSNLTEKVTKLESSALVLSEALYYGNNSGKSYSGAMNLLYEEISELAEMCTKLSCN